MIDTHAHVHDKAFDDDREAVIERARATGITAIVNAAEDVVDSARAIATARARGMYAAVGIHPHEAIDAPADIAAAFGGLLHEPEVVAIGETGLDYYYDHSPRDAQRNVLRAQLRIAREQKLPVIFHHRDAYDDFLTILREEFVPGMRGVIHCFTGNAQQARTYVDEFGLQLGIGGVMTFKNAQQVRDAICAVGLAPLVLETDCPYLAPVPHRGQRNEPAFITAIATRLADLLDRPLEEVVKTTDETAQKLFNLP